MVQHLPFSSRCSSLVNLLLRPSICTCWQLTGYWVCPFRDGPLPLCMYVGEGPILPAALPRHSSSTCMQSSGMLPKLKFQPSYVCHLREFLSFNLAKEEVVNASHFPHTYNISHSWHTPWFHHPDNIRWRVPFMKPACPPPKKDVKNLIGNSFGRLVPPAGRSM